MTKQDVIYNREIVSSKKVDVEVHSYQTENDGVSNWDLWVMACKPTIACAPGMISAECKSVNVMQMPGYGESVINDGAESLTLDDYVEAFDRVIDTNDGVLYGYSHSGYFMAQYAIKKPEKVKALILVEPALYTPKQELLDRIAFIEAGDDRQAMSSMLKFVGGTRGSTEEQVNSVASAILSNVNSSTAVANEYRVRAENEVTDEALAGLNIPVLLIGGTNSDISFMVKKAFQALPHAFVSWIEGATHLNLESGEYEKEMAAAINAFLQAVSSNNAKVFHKLMAPVKADRVSEVEAEMAF
jgi:pimeloyl-ACP methyl ester carboxylesterase